MSRPWIFALAPLLVLTACSGGGGESTPVTVPPSTTAAPTAVDEVVDPEVAVEVDDGDDVDDNAALADVVAQWSVTIDVVADGFESGPVDVSVGWTGDPNAVVEDGPFGSFGSCGGLRDHVGAYSVFVSGSDEVGLVGVWTADRVTGAGIFDAEVRVERIGGPPLTASGTITILDDLQQGEFLAFGADGGRIEGTFSCSGAEPAAPVSALDVDAIDAIEVFAVLREGDAERIVGLVTDSSDMANCAPGDDLVVVDGDASTGAITSFDLRDEPTPSVRLRIAGTDYEFPDVTVSRDDTGSSGVFSAATLDGTSVDGAFHCA